MRLFKGIVIDTQAPSFIKVKMETGFEFWAVAKPNMSFRSRVFVAWDFTNACPAEIYLKKGGDIDYLIEPETDIFSEPEIDDISRPDILDISISDIFSEPVVKTDEDDDIGLLCSSQNAS